MANSTKNVSAVNDADRKVVKFKLIFVNQKRKDGSSFVVMKTILKDNKWVQVKFGDNVNTKLFKGENQVITAYADDVKKPVSLESYVSKKDGKTKYPYYWVENIIGFEKLVGKPKEPSVTEQDDFEMDEPSTDEVAESMLNN